MITEAHGNLLDAHVDALVNTVNSVGVMGKGLALQFKRAYPEMFRDYARAAKAGEIRLGHVHVWPTGLLTGPRYIINFPTKGHWRANSQLGDIERGLGDLINVLASLDVKSIAIPPLGCGNGGLAWADVEPIIREAFAKAPEIHVVLYPPGPAPAAALMPTATPRPSLTVARASLISLLAQYLDRTLDASPIEVQKLMYFLQVAGEDLRLKFAKGLYGPYADNLRHALQTLEGHYLVGFGDGSAAVRDAEPLRLMSDARDEATAFLSTHSATLKRIDGVLELIEGFESTYGMELLATTYWVTMTDPQARRDVEAATTSVRAWSRRKGRMFTADHVMAAWTTLRDRGWITAH